MADMRYTAAVGRKFSQSGTALPFPGNTVVCMVDPASATHRILIEARDLLKRELGGVGQYAWLPDNSFHMTVFDCVCDPERRPEVWARHLPLDAPLAQVDTLLATQFAMLPPPEPFRMKYDRLILKNWVAVGLAAESSAEDVRIRTFRDQLSERVGVRQPGHATYGFHITFAYGIVELEETDQPVVERARKAAESFLMERFGVFEAARPFPAFFETMLAFPPRRG